MEIIWETDILYRTWMQRKEGNILFNDALNIFLSATLNTDVMMWIWKLYGKQIFFIGHERKGRKEIFYLMTHSTHFKCVIKYWCYDVNMEILWETDILHRTWTERKEGNILFNDTLNTFLSASLNKLFIGQICPLQSGSWKVADVKRDFVMHGNVRVGVCVCVCVCVCACVVCVCVILRGYGGHYGIYILF